MLLDRSDWYQIRDTYGEFRRLFLKLYDEYVSKRSGWDIGLLLNALELLLNIHRWEEPGRSVKIGVSPGMEAALHMIHTRFDTSITLIEIAKNAALGERQFHRKLKERTGMTFVDYVQTVRIDEACRLLRTSERKVADIASAVGYQDIGFLIDFSDKRLDFL